MNIRGEAFWIDILNAIGGEENLDAMAHCATRLRLVLNDESLVNEEALNNMLM